VRIASVNVGRPRTIRHEGRPLTTAIFKAPVAGPVAVGRTNLSGDQQADLSVHGGPDKAVYLYPGQHYPYWNRTLGRDDLGPAFFGENLTVEGMDEAGVMIGDVLRAGSALLEVSQPRVPCFKLNMRVGDPGFGKPFLASGRTGWYVRVLEEGELAAGDAIVREREGAGGMSVREVVALLPDGAAPEDLDRAAALPALALGWRERFAHRAIALRRRAR
jgi:MOSC domain-containing protein YiiM